MSQVTAEEGRSKHGIVIYDTKFGNTEKIARSLELGMKQAGIQTICANVKDVTLESLKEYDLIAAGAPTQIFTASKPMKEFLEKLKSADLGGKFGFAFETKYDSRISGSAAKFIEKGLRDLGLEIIVPRASATVIGVKGRPYDGAKLKELEEVRFHQIGVQVGASLAVARGGMIPV